MNILRISATALLLGGALAALRPAWADALPPQQPTPAVASAPGQSEPDTLPDWAINVPRPAALSVPQSRPAPKQLPLANFGQWSESASEN